MSRYFTEEHEWAEVDGDVTALPELPDGSRGLWNTSLMFDRDGDLVGTYRKIHRFGFGNGEPKLLEAGEEVIVLDLALGDRAGGAMAAEVAADDGAVCDPANPEACVEASQSEWATGEPITAKRRGLAQRSRSRRASARVRRSIARSTPGSGGCMLRAPVARIRWS